MENWNADLSAASLGCAPHELLSYDPTLGVLRWKVVRRGWANKVGRLAGPRKRRGSIEVKVDGVGWLLVPRGQGYVADHLIAEEIACSRRDDAEKGPRRLASRRALSSRAREALSARSGHYVTSATLPAQLGRRKQAAVFAAGALPCARSGPRIPLSHNDRLTLNQTIILGPFGG